MTDNDRQHDGDVDQRTFLRQFASEIAAALRDQEDRPTARTPHSSDDELYRALVFDEPLLDAVPNIPVAASSLSRQLLDPSSDYALSNRFVNGILYMCQHQQQSGNGTSSQQRSPNAAAIAKLAFTSLIEVPLQCCLVADQKSSHQRMAEYLPTLGNYLGSYQGHAPSRGGTGFDAASSFMLADESNEHTVGNTAGAPEQSHQEEEPSGIINNGEQPQGENHDNELDKETSTCSEDHAAKAAAMNVNDEVWAAESDPSDYDFDEGLPPAGISSSDAMFQQLFGTAATDDDWLDPKVLSKCKSPWTIDQARNALGSLLKLGSFTLLEPIFSNSTESELNAYIQKLTQLSLLLLHPRSSSEGSNEWLIDTSSMDDAALLAPLWILRDAASHSDGNAAATTTTRRKQSLVTAYLQTLQTLLAMDQARTQNKLSHSSTTALSDLCVASIVGLSALSAWCITAMEDTKSTLLLTVETVVDGMNDLAHLLERATAISDTYAKRLPTTLVPLLEILTGIHQDRVDSHRTVSDNVTAQAILNSGFLRQVLILAFSPQEAATTLSPNHPMFHSLWGLCITYPKIVGKYVFRYPGTNDLIRRIGKIQPDSSTAHECVPCILWHVFAWMQCQSGSAMPTSKIVWKNKSESSPPVSPQLTQDECRKVCSKAWVRLGYLIQGAIQGNDASKSKDTACDAITEWNRLLVFARIPSLAPTMKELLDASLLEDISNTLQSLPKDGKSKMTEDKNVNTRDDNEKLLTDEDDVHDRNKRSQRHLVIAEARRVLKEYKLFFQGAALGSSKTD
jgi:hypothetical protein